MRTAVSLLTVLHCMQAYLLILSLPACRSQLAQADRASIVPELRKAARYKYLGERKDIKMDELAAEIRDEEVLFRDSLTEAEKKRLQAKKETLRLAKEHANLENKLKVDSYVMPEQYVNERDGSRDRKKQMAVLKRRYEEAPVEEYSGNVEQKLWEDDLMHMAQISTGEGGDRE